MAKDAKDETKQRLGALLKGAFSGPPTPLKDMPKANGESRLKKDVSSPATGKNGRRRT
jgi:hypothetical protein